MKKALAFAALSLFSLLLWVSTVHAGTYTSSDFYNVTITTSEVTATGKITIPSKPPFDPGPYNISISVTTGSPDADCSPNCVYYKEVKNITKTTVETFTLEQLDPTKKYSLVIKSLDANKTLAPRVIPFQVEGVKKYTAVATTTTIAASLTGLRGNTNKFRLLVKTQPFEVADIKRFMLGGVEATPGLPLHPGVDVIKKPDANGEIRWNLGGFYPGTTYYTRVIEYSDANDPSKAFYTTEQKTVLTQAGSISSDQLVFEYNNGSLLIKGRVDPAKNSGFEKYDIKIQYSKDELNTFTDTYPPKRSIYPGHSVKAAEPTIPNDKGEYYLFISSGINPSTTYNIRETITLGGTKKITDGVFNSGTGYTPSTTANVQDSFEDRSYRLLAPFPGLSVLMDPDLCQEQVNQGKQVFGGSCDDQVSAFINLALKILIGAAAVLLVLRIMFEGYKYITTDIPRLKVSAKSGLWDAVLGLVLALSSFLILNTINPKLIENTVNIDRLEIGVLEEDRDTSPITSQRTIPIPAGAVASCVAGVEKVTTKGGVFYACKTIALKFKQMIDLAHSQGYTISGGGFRTRAEQEVLRGKHCGAANIYKEKVKCVPPTAYPGRSRHESGLAFDLTCDGATIKARDNKCFVWLQANAKNYGLYNYPAEPWHWSTDGR